MSTNSDEVLTDLDAASGFVTGGAIYPPWTDNQRLAIAIQADEFADAFFGRNGRPEPEEVDSLMKTLYDLLHVL